MFEAEAELMVREEGKGWSSPTQVILRYGFFKIEEKNVRLLVQSPIFCILLYLE